MSCIHHHRRGTTTFFFFHLSLLLFVGGALSSSSPCFPGRRGGGACSVGYDHQGAGARRPLLLGGIITRNSSSASSRSIFSGGGRLERQNQVLSGSWTTLRGGQQEDVAGGGVEIDSATITLDDEEEAATTTTTNEKEEQESSTPMPSETEPVVMEEVPSKNAILAPMVSALTCMGQSYSKYLNTYPIATKSLTAGLIFGLSDYCAQLIENRGSKNKNDVVEEEKKGKGKGGPSASSSSRRQKKVEEIKKKKMDMARIVTTTMVGLLYFGPAAHAWYEVIFQIFPSTSFLSTLYKSILGQILFGPTFTCIFFGANLVQSGDFSLGSWLTKIKRDLPGAWVAGLGFWPFVDFISYSVVPVRFIPLFVNFMSFIWTIYLSLIASRRTSGQQQ